MPKQDLVVSPQHRMLISSNIAERMFGTKDVLIAAKKLLGAEGIDALEDAQSVTYFHLLFDEHELVFSDGAVSESLFLGSEMLKSLSPKAFAEVTALFPEVLDEEFSPRAACPIIQSGKMAHSLVFRHAKNNRPFRI